MKYAILLLTISAIAGSHAHAQSDGPAGNHAPDKDESPAREISAEGKQAADKATGGDKPFPLQDSESTGPEARSGDPFVGVWKIDEYSPKGGHWHASPDESFAIVKSSKGEYMLLDHYAFAGDWRNRRMRVEDNGRKLSVTAEVQHATSGPLEHVLSFRRCDTRDEARLCFQHTRHAEDGGNDEVSLKHAGDGHSHKP